MAIEEEVEEVMVIIEGEAEVKVIEVEADLGLLSTKNIETLRHSELSQLKISNSITKISKVITEVDEGLEEEATEEEAIEEEVAKYQTMTLIGQ